MVDTAFQSDSFQNDSFQIVGGSTPSTAIMGGGGFILGSKPLGPLERRKKPAKSLEAETKPKPKIAKMDADWQDIMDFKDFLGL